MEPTRIPDSRLFRQLLLLVRPYRLQLLAVLLLSLASSPLALLAPLPAARAPPAWLPLRPRSACPGGTGA